MAYYEQNMKKQKQNNNGAEYAALMCLSEKELVWEISNLPFWTDQN